MKIMDCSKYNVNYRTEQVSILIPNNNAIISILIRNNNAIIADQT